MDRLLAWDSWGCIYNLTSFIGTKNDPRHWSWRAKRTPDFGLKRTDHRTPTHYLFILHCVRFDTVCICADFVISLVFSVRQMSSKWADLDWSG